MKKLILALLLALPSPALAAQAAQPSGYPPQLDYGSGGMASTTPLPDYLEMCIRDSFRTARKRGIWPC